jgi:NAD(P)H-dependent flavin oxidoreductase YrpB (nitropropane dioxygenase family)
MPSVKAAQRCKKAGVDVIIASGHEGGFHISWEPVHSMILLPNVVETVSDEKTLVVGAGGFADGRTLAAALTMGADGVQMGTRFLATEESDFPSMWKQAIVDAGDRGTLVARGVVGPARWIKSPRSIVHASNTLQRAPGVFLGVPDDDSTDTTLLNYEFESLEANYSGEKDKAMWAGGEVAQRINGTPKVKDLIESIMADCELRLRDVNKYLD